jgi:hypothetical protein
VLRRADVLTPEVERHAELVARGEAHEGRAVGPHGVEPRSGHAAGDVDDCDRRRRRGLGRSAVPDPYRHRRPERTGYGGNYCLTDSDCKPGGSACSSSYGTDCGSCGGVDMGLFPQGDCTFSDAGAEGGLDAGTEGGP